MDECSEIFVGAGWGGIYSFYRRIQDDPTRAKHACLMEASWRMGGRTYSVPVNHTAATTKFVVDVGAYRFTPDMHFVGDLILHELKLPTQCYQEHCPSAQEDFPKPFMFNYSAPLRRIVDPKTNLPSGYGTALMKMVERCQTLGARVFLQTKLVAFELGGLYPKDNADSDDTNNSHNKVASLTFRNMATGEMTVISAPSLVLLNLPRNKLLEVQGVAESLEPSVLKTIRCIVFDTPSDLFGEQMAKEIEQSQHYVTNLGKAYLYYQQAWWLTQLHLVDGTWPVDVGFFAQITPQGIRLNVRWYDGPVHCDSYGNSDSGDINELDNENSLSCSGLLELYYSVSNETFYSSLSHGTISNPGPANDDVHDPLGSIWETDGPEARQKLALVHEALVQSLKPLLQQRNINASSLSLPSGLIVGTWHRPHQPDRPLGGHGYTAPTKVLYAPQLSGSPAQACQVSGVNTNDFLLTDDVYRETLLQPWGTNTAIYLVNNDYSCINVQYYFGDWAEESLWQAERALYIQGMGPPAWLQNASYYQQNIVNKVANKWHLLNLINSADRDNVIPLMEGPGFMTAHSLALFFVLVAAVASAIVLGSIFLRSWHCKQLNGGYSAIP